MKFVNNLSLKDNSQNNLFNVIQEQNIRNERKGLLISIMQGLDKNSIKLKNDNDRFELIENLKNSYNLISSSPKLKLESKDPLYNDNFIEKKNQKHIDIDNLPVFIDRGKKHFTDHPSQQNNIKLEFIEQYYNSNERIDQLMKYYKEVGDKEKKYMFSPDIHSFYNKEQAVDPIQKYSKKVRAMNLSNENPHKTTEKTPNEYFVFKFNNNINKLEKSHINKNSSVINSVNPKDNQIGSKLIKDSYNEARKHEIINNRINNLKKDLENKNYYEINNSTLKNLKDDRDFDVVRDIQKQLEIKNDHDNIIFNDNNKNTIQRNNMNVNSNLFNSMINNSSNNQTSNKNFIGKLNQLNYLPYNRNLSNNSNNIIDIINSNKVKNEGRKEEKKNEIEYLNSQTERGINLKNSNDKYDNNHKESQKRNENLLNSNEDNINMKMIDPFEKLKILNQINAKNNSSKQILKKNGPPTSINNIVNETLERLFIKKQHKSAV